VILVRPLSPRLRFLPRSLAAIAAGARQAELVRVWYGEDQPTWCNFSRGLAGIIT